MDSADHVPIASLAVNGVGALLLCKGIAFGSARRYGQQNPAALYPRSTNIAGDVARATDAADNQAGAGLLVLGFLGQIVGAIQTEWSFWPSVTAYLVAAVVIAVGWFARPRLRRRYERDLYLARVELEFKNWLNGPRPEAHLRAAQKQYRDYMSSQGRSEELDGWCQLAQQRSGFDPDTWEAETLANSPPTS